jgi:hypothetical protein
MSAVGTAAAATMALSTFAAADPSQPSTSPETPQEAPLKDCTRYNGFYGFYGNVWCTPEEQARWDKWEAERLRKSTGAENPTRL